MSDIIDRSANNRDLILLNANGNVNGRTLRPINYNSTSIGGLGRPLSVGGCDIDVTLLEGPLAAIHMQNTRLYYSKLELLAGIDEGIHYQQASVYSFSLGTGR